MNRRIRKIQTRYQISGSLSRRTTKILPALELAGNWFQKAGFSPGQLVHIETRNGEIIIRPAHE